MLAFTVLVPYIIFIAGIGYFYYRFRRISRMLDKLVETVLEEMLQEIVAEKEVK